MAGRRLSRGCVCVYQSAEWALVKGLIGTDLVVDQALNDHQSINVSFKVTPTSQWTSQVVQSVKNLPAMQEIPVRFLGWEDPLEKAAHSADW